MAFGKYYLLASIFRMFLMASTATGLCGFCGFCMIIGAGFFGVSIAFTDSVLSLLCLGLM